MGKTQQETERERGRKGERRLSPSRRTKDEANNGEAFSEAEVAGMLHLFTGFNTA